MGSGWNEHDMKNNKVEQRNNFCRFIGPSCDICIDIDMCRFARENSMLSEYHTLLSLV